MENRQENVCFYGSAVRIFLAAGISQEVFVCLMTLCLSVYSKTAHR